MTVTDRQKVMTDKQKWMPEQLATARFIIIFCSWGFEKREKTAPPTFRPIDQKILRSEALFLPPSERCSLSNGMRGQRQECVPLPCFLICFIV
jgi:hypothetical protein